MGKPKTVCASMVVDNKLKTVALVVDSAAPDHAVRAAAAHMFGCGIDDVAIDTGESRRVSLSLAELNDIVNYVLEWQAKRVRESIDTK